MPYKDPIKQKQYFKEYDLKRLGKRNQYKRDQYQKVKDDPEYKLKRLESRKRWSENGGLEYYRDRKLKIKYGISLEDYKILHEAQGGVCAICGGTRMYGHKTRLTVDHDHKTKKIRGALCDPCNLGLGKFNDDIELLERAVNYLRAHNEDEN